ncbi:M48 family metallopeptidase [Lysobacter koreensis]|uniref:M48 family metallopeptidase n=1 Tax=Lysobacter koreensis TaxID=266122 RepID=A0ABW2YP23_9GAMM
MSLFRLLAGKPHAITRTIERDSFAITLGSGQVIDVARVRDPRARRIKLSVDERGPRLTLPLRASAAAGERFVVEHGDWLAAQMADACSGVARLQPHVDAHLPLRGVALPVHWHDGRYLRLELLDGALAVTAPATPTDAALRRALRDFYEAQARADVGRWLPQYLPNLPRAPSRVRFRMMSSQWGSLAPDGALSLDLALVLAPPPVFEYVLVHELCHLIHADHSRRFWREVEARCPHWRDQRDWFRDEGRRLKATLHTLCGNAR